MFITHAHYDHYDEPSLRNVVKADTTVVCPASMLSDVKGMNLGVKEVIGMKAGETEDVADGITKRCLRITSTRTSIRSRTDGSAT